MAFLEKKDKGKSYRDAKLIVVEEHSCPIYDVGEVFSVSNFTLSISSDKAGCLHLAQQIASIVLSRRSNRESTKLGSKKYRFDCGGCKTGKIYFDYKKEEEFITLHMKLLTKTKDRAQKPHLNKSVSALRLFKIFDSLDDDTLKKLTQLFEFVVIPSGNAIARKGTPGTHLYVILQGHVEIKTEDGNKLDELEAGEIFGGESLFSAEPLMNSFIATKAVRLAKISFKNFKHLIEKHPVIQIFIIFKMLVEQSKSTIFPPRNINSAMTGALDEIPLIEIFQLINASKKTGSIELALDNGKGKVFFKEGEFIYASYLHLHDREAIYALLRIKNGYFNYTPGIPEEFDKLPPLGGFMAIMMEGVKNLDESS